MLVPVCNGVRGNVLSIDLPTNALVEELSHSLKRHTDIDVESQVLMCEWEPDSGLSHRRTVASYGMPRQDEQIIFVFNKACFKQGASAVQAPEESAPVVRAQLPTQEQSLSASHCSLVNNLSLKANQAGVEPMQNAILDFLKRFLHFQAMGDAYATAARRRIQLCEQLDGEVGMQRRASTLALTSLQRYYKSVAHVAEKLDAEVAEAAQLMSTCFSHEKMEECIATLGRKELDAAHCAVWRLPAGTKLVCFVKDREVIKECVDACHALVAMLGKQVSDCKSTLQQLEAEVEQESRTNAEAEAHICRTMQENLERLNQPLEACKNAVQLAEMQVMHLETTLQAAQIGTDSTSMNWGQLFNETQVKYSEGKNSMEELEKLEPRDQAVHAQVQACWAAKRQMTKAVLGRLQRVAGMQGRLLSCKKHVLALLSAAKSERARRFAQVDMVFRLADTYEKWCAEVYHRNTFYNTMLSQAEAVSAWVQQVVDKEEERRVEFLERMQLVLPQALLQLLQERPNTRGGGHGRAPRMEVHVSTRSKRLPLLQTRPPTALHAQDLIVPLVSSPYPPDLANANARERERDEADTLFGPATQASEKPVAPLLQQQQQQLVAHVERERASETTAALQQHVAHMERELEDKELLWRKANQDKADLELRLDQALERLRIDEGRCAAAVAGLRRMAAAVGLTPVSGVSAAAAGGRGARARRSSKLGDKEGAGDADAAVLEAHNVDALAAAVERLAAAAAARDESAAGDSAASEAAREHTEDAVAEEEGESAEKEKEDEKKSLQLQLARRAEDLEKTKSLFNRAMVNAAALEGDIKKLQDAAKIDKAQRERVVAALLKIAAIVGSPRGLQQRERGLSATTPRSGPGGGGVAIDDITPPGERRSLSSGQMTPRARRISGSSLEDMLSDPEAINDIVASVAAAVGDVDPKISVSRFGAGDVALFMPCSKDRVDRAGNNLYVAFNVNCPSRFLHPDSLHLFFTQDPARAESYCLGRITMCHEATAQDIVQLNLPSEPQVVHVCHAVPILREQQ